MDVNNTYQQCLERYAIKKEEEQKEEQAMRGMSEESIDEGLLLEGKLTVWNDDDLGYMIWQWLLDNT